MNRHHSGQERVDVTQSAEGLDVVASRSGDRLFVHVINTQRTTAIAARISVGGREASGGRVFELAIEPEQEITQFNANLLEPVEKPLSKGQWTFPPASVSAIEIQGLEA